MKRATLTAAIAMVGMIAGAATLVSAGQSAPAGDPGARLPWDFPLPPLDFMLFRTGPTNGKPPESNGNVAPPMAVAQAAAQAALAKCTADGLKIGIAVVDTAGDLRVALSSDGVQPGKVYIATRKALAAAAFGVPTSRIAGIVKADPTQRARMTPAMAGFPGGVPLIRDGKPFGAIAASGAQAMQDEACAAAGAAAVAGRL